MESEGGNLYFPHLDSYNTDYEESSHSQWICVRHDTYD